MLPLVLLIALTQTGKTMPPGVAYSLDRGCQPNWLAAIASGTPINAVCAPFFEAFPQGGAGTFGPCSTTSPTSTKGVPLIYARAGGATCTKTLTGSGLTTTGIADGDLVSMTANQPRVEYDPTGTLGLLVESSRNNSCLRSEELNNAVWLTDSAGVAAPSVTPNATSRTPLATPTSLPERIQIPATNNSGTQYSRLYQAVTCSTCICSFYVLGNGTSGTIDVCQQSSGSSCNTCNYVSNSWTRCTAPVSTSTVVNCTLGNMSLPAYNGGVARAAHDIFVTAAQVEAGTYVTSYIPTTSAAVARNPDNAYFATTGGPGLANGCIGGSITLGSGTSSYSTVLVASGTAAPPPSGADQMTLYANGSSGSIWKCYTGNSAATIFSTGITAYTPPFAGIHRGWCAASGAGSSMTGAFDGNNMSASGSISGTFAPEAYLVVGSSINSITYVDGIISRIVRDFTTTRCR